MTHTGVTCNSAFGSVRANLLLIITCAIISTGLVLNKETTKEEEKKEKKKVQQVRRKRKFSVFKQNLASSILALSIGLLGGAMQLVNAQHAGVYDFGQGREGEKRGNWTPSQWTGVVLVIMVILGGLAITIGLCYYATKKARKGMMPVEQNDWS